MKNIYKKLLLLATLSLFNFTQAQTTLVAGDLAVVGYIGNGTVLGDDQFSFVLLKDITANTVIQFTENAWLRTSATAGSWRTGESTITWTSQSALATGTEVTIVMTPTLTTTSRFQATNVTAGTVAGTVFALSANGDSIIAYQGTAASPTFITALHMNVYNGQVGEPITDAAVWDGSYSTSNSCGLPTGLTTGVNAMWIGTQGNINSERDNMRLTCGTLDLSTVAKIKAIVYNQANYTTSDNLPSFTIPTDCLFLASAAVPEINLQGNAANILDGATTTSTANHTDFGSQSVCAGTIVRTFTIQNTGSGSLTVSVPTVSGTNASDFSINVNPTSPVAGSGFTTFQVTFNPSAAGTRSATISITNNDTDEATYDFAIQGTGTDPEINLQGNTANILDGATTASTANHTDFGSKSVCAGTIVRTFTIQNTGSSNLTISTPTITGNNAADFSITANPANPVAAAGSTTFQVTFNPSSAGIRVATINISNGDCDEATYDFAIQGTGGPNPTITAQAQTNISCFGEANGAASVNTVTGGTAPYSYNWTPGNPTGDGTTSITGLAAGDWTCTVTDANNCTSAVNFTITQPAAALVTSILSQSNVLCNGGSNGAASINTPTGGAGGYTYNWIPGNPTGDGTRSITGLPAGLWRCNVTDANNCTTTQLFNITQPAALVVSAFSQTNVSCNGGSNGVARITTPTGGAGGYSYNWTPGNPSGDGTTSVTGLTAGTWTCTVTDSNSCTATQTFNITQAAALNSNVTLNNGFLTADLAGATYQWFTCPNTIVSGANLQSFEPIIVGDYKVEITLGGCTVTSNCITVNTLGSESFENENFKIYPNPFSNEINFETTENFKIIEIYSILGKKVFSENFKTSINTSNLSNGVYLVKLIDATDKSIVRKMIKE